MIASKKIQLQPKFELNNCPHGHMITIDILIEHLATSLHLQLVAASCSHVITIWEVFWWFLAKKPQKNQKTKPCHYLRWIHT